MKKFWAFCATPDVANTAPVADGLKPSLKAASLTQGGGGEKD